MLKRVLPSLDANGRRIIPFENHGDDDVSLPSPAFLEMHAVLAK